MEKLCKFFPLVKVDEAQRIVYGLVTAEKTDKDGETCHYESTKPEYQAVNEEIGKASGGGNIMPLREMHQLNAVGAGKSISFDDGKKQIHMAFKVVDDSTWNKVKEKVLLGFSQGGSYLKRWTEGVTKYYTARPGEVSLVDNPCLPGAFIEYAKADGTIEMFKTPAYELTEKDAERIAELLRKSLDKGVKYLVPGGQHLPYTDESGKPSHSHMGAAWAALHGGYRGNKYEGPGKEQAIAHLKEIYRQEGMEPPSEKAAAAMAELEKLLGYCGADLNTELQKFSDILAQFMRETCPVIGAAEMNPEQVKKCAAALGITEDDFKKQFASADDLAKAHGGLAALHGHIGAAMEHHDAMHKAHMAMGAMHEKHAAHLAKCHKACGAVMGSDGKASEKALHDLLDELKKGIVDDAPAKDDKKDDKEVFTKAEAETLVADAIKKAIAELPEPNKGIRVIPRLPELKKTETPSSDPLPV